MLACKFSVYDLLLPPGINQLTQQCLKSTKSMTIHKHLKKLLQIKIMHALHVLQQKSQIFTVFIVFVFWNLSINVLFFLPMFLFLFVLKGVSYCHKVFCLRCCKSLIPSSVCTNMNCMSKQSYSITWQKIKTGHCEFNI